MAMSRANMSQQITKPGQQRKVGEDEMGAGGMTRYGGGGVTYAKSDMTKSGGRDGCAIKGKTKGRKC